MSSTLHNSFMTAEELYFVTSHQAFAIMKAIFVISQIFSGGTWWAVGRISTPFPKENYQKFQKKMPYFFFNFMLIKLPSNEPMALIILKRGEKITRYIVLRDVCL